MPPAAKPAPPANAPREVGKPLATPAQVTRVRYSPCGTVLAAAGFDAVVRRWDVSAAEAKELPPLTGHNGWVSALAFGPAKPALYTADSWGRLVGRDYSASADAKPLWSVPAAHDGWLRMIAAGRDGSTVATCGRDGFVRLWATKSGAKRGEFSLGTDVLAVAFAPDVKSVLTGDLFGVVRQLDLSSGKVLRTFEVREFHKLDRIQDVGGVRGFAFDPDGKHLAVSGGEPATGGFVQCTPLVVAFDWSTGTRTFALKGATEKDGFVTDLRWHPGGTFLMLTTSGQPGVGAFSLWKPGEPKPFFVAAKPNCHSLDLHPGGTRVAIAATNANSSGNGRVKGKGGEYLGNTSPIHVYELPPAV